MAMERRWSLPGAYADWTLTVTTSPGKGAVEPFDDNWEQDTLDRIGAHFFDAVALMESLRTLEEISRRGSILM